MSTSRLRWRVLLQTVRYGCRDLFEQVSKPPSRRYQNFNQIYLVLANFIQYSNIDHFIYSITVHVEAVNIPPFEYLDVANDESINTMPTDQPRQDSATSGSYTLSTSHHIQQSRIQFPPPYVVPCNNVRSASV